MDDGKENLASDEQTAIRPHGGYRDLIAFVITEIVYDWTVTFCHRAFPRSSRTAEQMIQAARSGKQNIAEGSVASAASQKSEIFLTNCARASLEELVLDLEDFLRQNGLIQWSKDEPKARFIRGLHLQPNRSYETYKVYVEAKSIETAANTLLCLCHQASYLLDRLIRKLERDIVEEGGFAERLRKLRIAYRKDKDGR